MRKSLWVCLILFVVLVTASSVNRYVDAVNHGDWRLMYVQDSFMGYPLTHILVFLSLIPVIVGALIIWRGSSTTSSTETGKEKE